jgi:hypothetical protein
MFADPTTVMLGADGTVAAAPYRVVTIEQRPM